MSDVEYKPFRLYHFETCIKVFCREFDKEAKSRISSCFGVRYVTFTLLYGDFCACHHGMVLTQVADGGTASNMEGNCEYIE